jgi:signal transduction histidine kinase
MENPMLKKNLILLGLSAVVALPVLGQSKEEAEAFVKQAAAFAKENGTYKLIKAVNTPDGQFKKGELYIWIVDMDGVMLAHGANSKLIGKDFSEAHDSESVRYAEEAVKVAQKQGSGWIDYRFVHPETKKVQAKTCYVEKCGPIVIACGIYMK